MSYFTGEAHGRVNLIGEHTDYNGGYVFPTAIPQSTKAMISPRNDQRVLITSPRMNENLYEYSLGKEKAIGDWPDFIQGLTWILRKVGFKISGFEATIESNIPIGSGLSSSAALEISMMRALR